MSDRDLIRSIPDSYDDFVDDIVRWMEQDENIRNAILAQMKTKPDSDTSDVLEVLCRCLGVEEPAELVDDEEENGDLLVVAGARTAY